MPVEVVRLADSSMSLKAQPIDMPHGGWCKPPARPVVMIVQPIVARQYKHFYLKFYLTRNLSQIHLNIHSLKCSINMTNIGQMRKNWIKC